MMITKTGDRPLVKPAASPRSSRRRRLSAIALAAGLLPCTTLPAGEVDVTDVAIESLGGDRYRIDATLRHDDTGWDHYANRWEVRAPDGRLLGTRELLHPHVEEQPFTRSLTLEIPREVATVTIVAFDSVHADGGTTRELAVPD